MQKKTDHAAIIYEIKLVAETKKIIEIKDYNKTKWTSPGLACQKLCM